MNLEKVPISNSNPTSPEPVFSNELEAYVIPKAYERATTILEEQAIRPEMFQETYSEKLLTDCAAYVAKCEQRFKETNESDPASKLVEMFGKTLEGLLHDQINKGVYGKGVRGVATAKYDDYREGIDEVIERQSPDGSTYIGCALDFTFGWPVEKINSITNDIKAGILHDVTFYESPFGDPPHIHGKLQGIPKVVVGMDSSHLVNLAELWLRDDENIGQNQLFLLLLRQIEQQAEVYEILAKRAQRKAVAERYKQIHTVVSDLYNEQKMERGVTMLDTAILNDTVNKAIVQKMSELLNS